MLPHFHEKVNTKGDLKVRKIERDTTAEKKFRLSPWCLAVKHAMVDRGDMTSTELAKRVGRSPGYVSKVVNGTYISIPVMADISKCLDIDIDEYLAAPSENIVPR